MPYPDSFVNWFVEELEKAAGAPTIKEGRKPMVEIVAELKAKADKWDAHVAELRSAPLRLHQSGR